MSSAHESEEDGHQNHKNHQRQAQRTVKWTAAPYEKLQSFGGEAELQTVVNAATQGEAECAVKPENTKSQQKTRQLGIWGRFRQVFKHPKGSPASQYKSKEEENKTISIKITPPEETQEHTSQEKTKDGKPFALSTASQKVPEHTMDHYTKELEHLDRDALGRLLRMSAVHHANAKLKAENSNHNDTALNPMTAKPQQRKAGKGRRPMSDRPARKHTRKSRVRPAEFFTLVHISKAQRMLSYDENDGMYRRPQEYRLEAGLMALYDCLCDKGFRVYCDAMILAQRRREKRVRDGGVDKSSSVSSEDGYRPTASKNRREDDESIHQLVRRCPNSKLKL